MKEIPILFSAPMVQAILAGRKTITRRIAAVPAGDHHGTDIMDWGLSKHPYQENGKWLYRVQSEVDDYNTFELKPKYGQPGDVLWVRETFCVEAIPAPPEGDYDQIIYRYKVSEKFDPVTKWKPSIFMPKSAARIWLQVTDIRVERLQSITAKESLLEGIEECEWGSGSHLRRAKDYNTGEWFSSFQDEGLNYCRMSFQSLWESINGPESWAANPWVWVIGFKVLSITGKPELQTEKTIA